MEISSNQSKVDFLKRILAVNITYVIIAGCMLLVGWFMGYDEKIFDVVYGCLRIVAMVSICVYFKLKFDLKNVVSCILYLIPSLLFVVYNLVVGYKNKFAVSNSDVLWLAAFECLSVALLEETLFRALLLDKKAIDKFSNVVDDENKDSRMVIRVLIAAFVFSLEHIPGSSSGGIGNVAFQMLFALVLGLNFGLVYAITQQVVPIMVVHFLIDFTGLMFNGASGSGSAAGLAAQHVLGSDEKHLFFFFVSASLLVTTIYVFRRLGSEMDSV